MERYEQHRTASISRALPVYHSGWRVQAGKEDGIAEIDLSFLQHQAPHSCGFLFVGGWVDLGMTKRITLVKNEKMEDL